jgi:uncharacterized protein YchJ
VNASHIVNLRYSIKGKDTHYLIKTDHAQAQTDLNELGISSDYVVKMYIQMQTTLVKGRVNYLSL